MNTPLASSKPSAPWYRYPLVWMMLAIPFSAVIMGIIMMTLAVQSEDGLVVDDYYKQGLGINEDISRDKRAESLRLSGDIQLNNTARLVTVRFDKGLLADWPEDMKLGIQHATRSDSDQFVELVHGINDQYQGRLSSALVDGAWYFSLTDADWKLISRIHISGDKIIHLESRIPHASVDTD